MYENTSIFKRGKIWYVRTWTEEGKERWVSTRCRMKSDALKVAGTLASEERERVRMVERMTLSGFWKEYESRMTGVHTEKTMKAARSAWNELCRYVGEGGLRALTPSLVSGFIAHKIRTASPYTGRRLYVTVSAILAKAETWGFLPSNPFRKVQKPKPPERRQAVVEYDQVREICGFLCPALSGPVEFAFLTGMRSAEIRHLHIEDVVDGWLFIRNRDGFKTKNGRERRIPLHPKAVALLEHYAKGRTEGLVFSYRGRMLSETYLSHGFKKAARKAGFPEMKFHGLRHSHATAIVKAGGDIFTLSRLLGHSSVSVTERSYVHHSGRMEETVALVSL